MSPTEKNYGERLARLDEWKLIHERDHNALTEELGRLRKDTLRGMENVIARIDAFDDRVREMEKFANNMRGRMFMLGLIFTGINTALLVFAKVFFK